jgi:glycosyltransferase involved in cell wall biosynthesis
MDLPLVSVITPSFNAGGSIERTIRSVLAQNYAPLEYFVVDGGSTDGTLDIIRRYSENLTGWKSEPDRGIADAFNKGLAMASGKYVLFVNADDWLEPDHVATAVEVLEQHPNMAFVFGDLVHHRGDAPAYLQTGGHDYAHALPYRMGRLNHPSMVFRRAYFDRIGVFDTRYTIAMDFNWLQRLHRAGFGGIYSDRLRGNMQQGGLSGRHAVRALRETRHSSIAVGYNPIVSWAYYLWARSKLSLRRTVEKWASPAMATRLRAKILGSVKAVPPDTGRTGKL